VPGDSSRLFWKGIHRASDLPWLLNPVGGYVHNANSPPWWTSLAAPLDPARYPPYIERGQLSLRAQAALGVLEGTDKFSTDSARRLKFSTRMLAADRMLPDLVAAVEQVSAPSEALVAGLDTLTAWDRHANADSRGAVLFERFQSLYDGAAAGFSIPWSAARPITTPTGLSDSAAAVAALERAVVEVRREYGSERIAWGEIHRFRFGDIDLPADGAAARHGVYRVVGFEPARDGIRVAGHPGPGQPLAGSGDGWVLMVHFTRPVEAWSVLAYGQTTNLDSPHSRDQIELFAGHSLRPAWFSEAAIAANLERRYRPGGSAMARP
jgi:acyl-homoserine-lactone acylase